VNGNPEMKQSKQTQRNDMRELLTPAPRMHSIEVMASHTSNAFVAVRREVCQAIGLLAGLHFELILPTLER